MADQLATFRQQRFSRLLALCAVGKFPDAVYETCAPNVSPLVLQQLTQGILSSGGTIAWVEPLQITPQLPPRINTGLCIRVCAVFQRYAFGRGQAIFDVGFGPDERIFELVPDPAGYHLVQVNKQPGSYWIVEPLPDPVQVCKVRVDLQLPPGSKQVLAFPGPPMLEGHQTDVSFKSWPESLPVLAHASSVDKMNFLVADANTTSTVTAEITWNYTRRVLTVKTPQPGTTFKTTHLHETIERASLASDIEVYNWKDPGFQGWLNQTGLRRMQGEDGITFARRAILFIAANFTYNPVSPISRQGGGAFICTQREGDSTAHAILYVCILRANNVPSRCLVGRWVSNDIQPVAHTRVEFFEDPIGWIPVEATEKGEVLYFGSDPKAPFLASSFGETSQFRIQSTTQYNYGSHLPMNVNLGWREPHFVMIATNLSNRSALLEQWSSLVDGTGTTLPNVAGASHQQATTQRFAKAHDSGPPTVGARSRPFPAKSTSVTSSMKATNAPLATTYAPPPPLPNRGHQYGSTQVTAYSQTGFVHTQAPPPALPPHPSQYGYGSPQPAYGGPPQQYGTGGGYAPPPLPPHQQSGPPPLPPSSYSSAMPPTQPYATQPSYAPPAYGYQQSAGAGGPPPLPSSPSNAYGGPPPLPASNSPSYQQQSSGGPPPLPPSASYNAGPPKLPPQSSQYQQYSSSPAANSQASPMPNPTIVQPKPVAAAPPNSFAKSNATPPVAKATGGPLKAGPTKAGPVKSPSPVPPGGGGAPTPTGGPKKGVASAGGAKSPAAPAGGSAPTENSSVANAPTSSVALAKAPAAAPKKMPVPSSRVFARASYDHTPQDHLELALQKGDIIQILSEDDSGWWKAEKLGKSGIVPAPYIEKLPPSTRIAKAVFPFAAQEPTDLQLQVDEYSIIVASDGDWWQAEARGTRGNVPNNYIEELKL